MPRAAGYNLNSIDYVKGCRVGFVLWVRVRVRVRVRFRVWVRVKPG